MGKFLTCRKNFVNNNGKMLFLSFHILDDSHDGFSNAIKETFSDTTVLGAFILFRLSSTEF